MKKKPLLKLTDKEWKKKLTESEYDVLRRKKTEKAFSGKYWDFKEKGTYHCAGCQEALFQSQDKFKSGTGWPSFTSPINPEQVTYQEDIGFFTTRTEVLCSHCKGHLGHLFYDGPAPAKTRYCINSVALKFKKE